MDRIAVVSSNLKSVGYDPQTRVLEVEFRNGVVWEYPDVDPSLYEEMIAAPSIGAYFSRVIKCMATDARRVWDGRAEAPAC